MSSGIEISNSGIYSTTMDIQKMKTGEAALKQLVRDNLWKTSSPKIKNQMDTINYITDYCSYTRPPTEGSTIL